MRVIRDAKPLEGGVMTLQTRIGVARDGDKEIAIILDSKICTSDHQLYITLYKYSKVALYLGRHSSHPISTVSPTQRYRRRRTRHNARHRQRITVAFNGTRPAKDHSRPISDLYRYPYAPLLDDRPLFLGSSTDSEPPSTSDLG